MYIALQALDNFSTAVLELYRCQTSAELINRTLAYIHDLIPYESAAYFPVNASAELEAPVSIGLDERIFAHYHDHYSRFDCYRTAVFFQKTIPVVDRASDYLKFMDWEKNEHRADFLLPNNMHYLLGLQLFDRNALIGTFSLHRNKHQRDFDDTEKQLLRLLSHHIQENLLRVKASETNFMNVPVTDRIRVSCGLTPREAEILQFLANGDSNKQIADHLFISTETVKTHLRSLFKKTKVSSRAELLVRCIKFTQV